MRWFRPVLPVMSLLACSTLVNALPIVARQASAWRVTGANRAQYSVSIDSTTAVHGGNSLRLQANEDIHDSLWAASEGPPIDITVRRGGHLHITAFLRTEHAREAALWARVVGESDGNYVTWSIDNMDGRVIEGTTTWKQYEIVLPAPEGARVVVLGTLLRGNGTVWVDLIELDAVSEDVELTGTTEAQFHDFPYSAPGRLLEYSGPISFEAAIR